MRSFSKSFKARQQVKAILSDSMRQRNLFSVFTDETSRKSKMKLKNAGQSSSYKKVRVQAQL